MGHIIAAPVSLGDPAAIARSPLLGDGEDEDADEDIIPQEFLEAVKRLRRDEYDVVWDFHIGGYQVCHKWLKDRKGRTLSDEDLAHYQKIVVALNGTIRLMREIDGVIDEHGGWPDAFQTVGLQVPTG